jgi:hypothetical protein
MLGPIIQVGQHIPEALPSKPKRARKPVDYAQLVLPRTGRLTRAYWILAEAFTQDVRAEWLSGSGKIGQYNWFTTRHVYALAQKGYLTQVTGPRGGKDLYRITPDGAFAMLIAKGQHEAKKQQEQG